MLHRPCCCSALLSCLDISHSVTIMCLHELPDGTLWKNPCLTSMKPYWCALISQFHCLDVNPCELTAQTHSSTHYTYHRQRAFPQNL